MLADLLKLPTEFPDIHQEFMKGNFVAQLMEGSKFSRVETDKVIEMTLNKDTKTPGNSSFIFTSVTITKSLANKLKGFNLTNLHNYLFHKLFLLSLIHI